jgi:hypothetical protein
VRPGRCCGPEQDRDGHDEKAEPAAPGTRRSQISWLDRLGPNRCHLDQFKAVSRTLGLALPGVKGRSGEREVPAVALQAARVAAAVALQAEAVEEEAAPRGEEEAAVEEEVGAEEAAAEGRPR